jgi:hypothetical protein
MKHEGFKINKESIPTVKLFPKTDFIMGYESPIHTLTDRIAAEIRMKADEQIWEAVVRTGVVVDKDELVKALKYDRDQYNKGYVNGYNADKWISVEDRLPDKYGKYLCCTEYGDITIETFFDAVRAYAPGFANRLITHWMPLPEPPKEDAE